MTKSYPSDEDRAEMLKLGRKQLREVNNEIAKGMNYATRCFRPAARRVRGLRYPDILDEIRSVEGRYAPLPARYWVRPRPAGAGSAAGRARCARGSKRWARWWAGHAGALT